MSYREILKKIEEVIYESQAQYSFEDFRSDGRILNAVMSQVDDLKALVEEEAADPLGTMRVLAEAAWNAGAMATASDEGMRGAQDGPSTFEEWWGGPS